MLFLVGDSYRPYIVLCTAKFYGERRASGRTATSTADSYDNKAIR